MPRKGFHRVTREQSRAATIRNFRGFKDTAVDYAKRALAAGDGRTAQECLRRAEWYAEQAYAMEWSEPPARP